MPRRSSNSSSNDDNDDDLSENARIVRPHYLERAANQKDLLRRLRKLLQVLQQDETIEAANPTEWPGVAAVAELLAVDLLRHKDRTVRLYTTACCMELLAIYAPECPWNQPTLCRLFGAIIQQVGNLSHAAESVAEYPIYARMLQHLAVVKIGVVLVEMVIDAKDDDDDDDDVVPSDNHHHNNHNGKHKQDEDIESFGSQKSNSSSQDSSSSSSTALAKQTRHARRPAWHDQLQSHASLPLDAPLTLLVRFFRTLLQSIRREHSSIIQTQIVQALTACLEEYHPTGVTVPIPVLDELLLAIAAGPKQQVVDASKIKPGAPLRHIKVENPTFTAAAKCLQKTADRLATPTAALLSGLLQADPLTVQQSSLQADPASAWSGQDVFSVVRHLHRVVPNMLTAVWGHVKDGLVHPDTAQRLAAVQLVGYILTARPSTDNFALLTAWWQRQHDVQASVRQALLQPCLALTAHWSNLGPGALSTLQAQALEECCRVVQALVVSDTTASVRLASIHAVCQAVYEGKPPLPRSYTARLLQAVGKRVSARQLAERQDALTGLVKLYQKWHMQRVLETLPKDDDNDEEAWMACLADLVAVVPRRGTAAIAPRNLWGHEAATTGKRRDEDADDDDSSDQDAYHWIPQALFHAVQFTDMRSRVVQLVDEGLLPRNASQSARAVGVAHVLAATDASMVVDWDEASAALRYFVQLQTTKARLQRHLHAYLEQRQAWRQLKKGTEEALASETQAMELLKTVASLSDGPTDIATLKALHRARDEHIFRLLRSLATPLQTKSARQRATQELPKRCQFLENDWMKQLVRRCGMGDFLNADTVQASATLAQQCLEHGQVAACASFLVVVKVAAHVFPELCGQPATFTVLRQLFSMCRSAVAGGLKKQVNEWRLVTELSGILSQAAACRPDGDCEQDDDDSAESPGAFRTDLLRLCTGDGTPTQARHAVYTLSRLESSDATSSPSANPMSVLVNKVASPLRLSATNEKQISLLSALTALADCAPDLLTSQTRGKKALIYALEDILMGRRGDENESSDDEDAKRKSKRGRKSPSKKNRHATPKSHNVLDDESLSAPCRRLCAAIAFLTSHIRATYLHRRPSSPGAQEALSKEQVMQFFQLLVQILRDNGLPPNDCDRKKCDTRQERAALRQVAGVHLLRLCDSRLGLEKLCLSTAMWYSLGEAFLDEEKVVRECILGEFSDMLKGKGVFGVEGSKIKAQAPALRFVSFVCLCVDADNSNESVAANGFAAQVGKTGVKAAVETCVSSLRTVCDTMYNTCRANGTEEQFENIHKMRVMPEYMVPYALYLLALRRETPGLAVRGDDDTSLELENECQDKILAKRLSALFEPLVLTLGEGADNISFLLRMTELLGKRLAPVPISGSVSSGTREVPKLKNKLDKILSVARETLLAFVKTDVNLEQYPGVVQIPGSLFKKYSNKDGILFSGAASKPKATESQSTTTKRSSSGADKPASNRGSTSSKKRRIETPRAAIKDPPPHVHFSPDVKLPTPKESLSKQKSFDGISPIGKRVSPFASPPATSIRETQTLGSTPPSGLRIATIQSTAPDSGTDADEESNVSSKPVKYVMRPSLKLNPSDLASDDEDNIRPSQSSDGSSLTIATTIKGKASKPKQAPGGRSSARLGKNKKPADAPEATLVTTDEQENDVGLSQESSIHLGEPTGKAKGSVEKKRSLHSSRRSGKVLEPSQDDDSFAFMSSQEESNSVGSNRRSQSQSPGSTATRRSPRGKKKAGDENTRENRANAQAAQEQKSRKRSTSAGRSTRALRSRKG